MARIDDDREAQRANERLIKEMRKQEMRAKDKATVENAFSQLLQKSQGSKQADARARMAEAKAGDQEEALSFDKLLAEATSQSSEETQSTQARSTTRELQRSSTEGLRRGDAKESERGLERKGADDGQAAFSDSVSTHDRNVGEARSEGRAGDQRDSARGFNEKGSDLKQGGAAAKGSARGGGALKADGDGGGKQGGGSGGKDSQGGNAGGVPAGFRFNPALMAPVPVAQAKPGGSERLRAIANEIAQKIVERVRVGTNAAGAAEFQIDLRSNVLKGLSIKVSSGNGKIRATFSGSDKEILRLLRENSESLKTALGSRGLTLEDLRIEERA